VTVLAAGGQIWRAYGQATPEIGVRAGVRTLARLGERSSRRFACAVHAAILSSNAFNTQPWLFKVSPSRIEIYADTKRNLGAFDPYLREMFFSLGCALENLCLTAPAQGLRASVSFSSAKLEPIPDQPKQELAVAVDLHAGPRNSGELFNAIPHRHTNREPFDAKREVPAEFVHSIASLVRRDEEDVTISLSRKRATEDKSWMSSGIPARNSLLTLWFEAECKPGIAPRCNKYKMTGTAPTWARPWRSPQALHCLTPI
jgi:hypothetical protein